MIFDGIIKGVGGFLKRREERKKEEALLKVRLVEAGYDSTKDSWKDEYITLSVGIVFLNLPVIFCLLAWDEGIERLERAIVIISNYPDFVIELIYYVVLSGLGIIGIVKPGLKFLERRGIRQNGARKNKTD